MLESVSDYALVNKPKESYVCGNVLVKNSPDTQFGDRYYLNGPVTLICPTGEEGEAPFTPEILDGDLTKSNGFDKKTDNNDEVGIVNQQKFKIRKLHLLAGAFSLVVIATVATLAVVLTSTTHPEHDEDGGNGTLEIIGRQVWNASNITENYLPLIHPTNYVIVAHTAGRNCKSVEECSFVLRYIQEYHIKKGFGDIGYNFVIGGDGRAYVGRGWDSQGRHTKPFNSRSIGIAFAGTFTTELPSKRALKAAKLLLKTGVSMGKLSQNYTLYCQKQVINTESPGLKLIQELKTWDHWHVYDPLHEKPEYTSETTIFI